MIRQILIPNLKRREDRKLAMLGHLLSPQINAEQHHIRFFDAHDGQDYETAESVVDAAVADGFPQFYEKFSRYHFNKNRWATHWTFCACLREIANCPYALTHDYVAEPYLLLIDDMRLLVDFPQIGFITGMAMRLPPKFQALQLFSYLWPWDVPPVVLGIDGFLHDGFGGRGDYGTVITPTGAERLLVEHFKEPYDTLSSDFLKIARYGEIGSGFYGCRSKLVETSSWDFGNDRGE